MSSFITKEMFLNLASCITIVCAIVQIMKGYVPISPLWINLIASVIVTAVRIIFIGDYSAEGLILGVLNIIPIMLGATGIYEVAKNVVQSEVSISV